MNQTTLHSGSVVVGVDGSRSSERAVDWAVQHAVQTYAPLVLVHSISTLATSSTAWPSQIGVTPPAFVRALEDDGERLVAETASKVTTQWPDVSVSTVVRPLDPRHALLAYPRASLLVVGSRGRGHLRSLLLGSVSAGVSQHAECPVVIVRPHREGQMRHGVLVGVDGTSHALPALEFAFRYASCHDLPLTVLHSHWDALADVDGRHPVPEDDPDLVRARLALAESVSGFGEKYPDVRVCLEVTRGLPSQVLIRRSDRMNLVVVGRHARHGHRLSRMGAIQVATSVVEHSRCPVAVVKDRHDSRPADA